MFTCKGGGIERGTTVPKEKEAVAFRAPVDEVATWSTGYPRPLVLSQRNGRVKEVKIDVGNEYR